MTQHSAGSLENCDDNYLALLVKDKNDTAFEIITARYMKLISAVASKYRFGTDEYDMSDFIQEGLLGLLSACNTYEADGGMTFKNYALLCIENRYRSILRHHNKKSIVPSSSIVPIDDTVSSIEDINSVNIQESIEAEEYIRSMYKKISGLLSDMEKRVLSLYLLGYSYSQTAKKLNISDKAVDNALYRIRKKLIG